MYSAEEVVELAINTEKNGKKFYDGAAKSAESQSVRELFDFLATQEEAHRRRFEALRGRTEKLVQPEDMEEVTKYLNAIVASEFFMGNDKALARAGRAKTRDELLSFALQFEKETLLFFTQISELAEGRTKAVLKEIIGEEKKHVKMITELLREQGIA
ncbi:MAG: ferritin family protein [Candidatus Thermoplasmatota archaeon]|nr:ferritin family protein [Candidatus Thermoplasmatota archaeon]